MERPAVAAIFDSHAREYDTLRRRLIPPFDGFYGTAVEALALGIDPPRRILDLGAGTGLLSRLIRDVHPEVELVLLDASPPMLEQARAALAEPIRLEVGDFSRPLPTGPFDAVVSALAIHHLEDGGKRELFGRILGELAPGGVFVNADQVAGATPELQVAYQRWHREGSLAGGATEAEWAAAEQRMALDRYATTEDQLSWLRAAGFAAVDLLFKHYGFAVLLARAAL